MQNRFEEFRAAVQKYDPQSANTLKSSISITHTHSNRDEILTDEPQSSHTLQIKSTNSQTGFMKEFHDKSNVLENVFTKITKNNNFLRELKLKALQTSEIEVEREINENLNKVVDENNNLVQSAKWMLEIIQNQTNELADNSHTNKQQDPNTNSHTQLKIRNNITNANTRRFQEVISEFQEIQTEIKNEVEHKIKRQIKIVYPDANEYELKELVVTGTGAPTQALMSRMTNQSLKNAVADISDKYKAIQKLERSAVELNKLFTDLATVVNFQSDMINNISKNVQESKDYTEKGVNELIKARKYQIASKKQTLFFVTVLAIFVAVVIIIILFV